jgi:putative ABC transport system ATP-binding protein
MILDLHNICKTYPGPSGPVHAVRGLSLQVAKGEFVAICGPSGSGKTTLLLTIGGLLAPDAGEVRVHDQDVYKLGNEARARWRARTIGFVFQQYHLLPYLNVLENVLAPAVAYPEPQLRQRAQQLIADLGLSSRERHLPSALSSGERQRTALARALLHRPPLLLADEPTGNLDEQNGRLVLDYLAGYAAAGAALLLVTHDSRAASQARRVINLGKTP